MHLLHVDLADDNWITEAVAEMVAQLEERLAAEVEMDRYA